MIERIKENNKIENNNKEVNTMIKEPRLYQEPISIHIEGGDILIFDEGGSYTNTSFIKKGFNLINNTPILHRIGTIESKSYLKDVYLINKREKYYYEIVIKHNTKNVFLKKNQSNTEFKDIDKYLDNTEIKDTLANISWIDYTDIYTCKIDTRKENIGLLMTGMIDSIKANNGIDVKTKNKPSLIQKLYLYFKEDYSKRYTADYEVIEVERNEDSIVLLSNKRYRRYRNKEIGIDIVFMGLIRINLKGGDKYE